MSLVETAQITWDLLTCDEVDEFGNRFWYDENDMLHREDGPAVIRADGSQIWYAHGEPHREDGPAIIRANGPVDYWVDGEYLTEEEFNARKLTVNG